jgi:hypothetical protein
MIKNNYENTRMMEAEMGLKYDQPKMTGDVASVGIELALR